mmetsp:Transcript_12590/g.24653  ORF Transcript_12590/g.24653 Transcript_12590/m.24653 type:complete len:234 (-) Transcript_12590:1006-1707(-)
MVLMFGLRTDCKLYKRGFSISSPPHQVVEGSVLAASHQVPPPFQTLETLPKPSTCPQSPTLMKAGSIFKLCSHGLHVSPDIPSIPSTSNTSNLTKGRSAVFAASATTLALAKDSHNITSLPSSSTSADALAFSGNAKCFTSASSTPSSLYSSTFVVCLNAISRVGDPQASRVLWSSKRALLFAARSAKPLLPVTFFSLCFRSLIISVSRTSKLCTEPSIMLMLMLCTCRFDAE